MDLYTGDSEESSSDRARKPERNRRDGSQVSGSVVVSGIRQFGPPTMADYYRGSRSDPRAKRRSSSMTVPSRGE